jgi:hypothetical protein
MLLQQALRRVCRCVGKFLNLVVLQTERVVLTAFDVRNVSTYMGHAVFLCSRCGSQCLEVETRAIRVMLSQQELEALLNLMKEPSKAFEAIAVSFYKNFTKADQFKAGCVICMLIQDGMAQNAILVYVVKLFKAHFCDSIFILYMHFF